MIVYSFNYCPDIHESAFKTISIHKTAKGAYLAMKKHLLECYGSWYESRITYGKTYFEKFGEYETWVISKLELLD